jgi:tetratricopeptide (TPR) repeat protein
MTTYRLVRPLSLGQHTEVWEAEDDAGRRVALKRSARDAAQLHNEALNTARLHHPGVVQVLDVGVLDGQPFVVQELSPLGPLPFEAAADWPAALEVLTDVLSALAHAHAVGVVHRDLKPGNLLRFPAPPRYRLADFGIAGALEDATIEVSGTLAFCAPEQLRGDALWPATDLYAVGCLGWLLLTGEPPFSGDVDALFFAHQFSPPPRFAPRFPAPDGIEPWLRGLLEKEPVDRPHLAADALAGLRGLAPERPAPPRRRRPPPTGPRLAGLRSPPVAGRHAEKALLLELLEDLDAPRQVVIRGPAGVGKSALAEWLAVRANTDGLAVTARMEEGVSGLVAHALRCQGADEETASARVDEAIATSDALHPADRFPLLALLRDAEALRPAELAALLPRLLRHIARGRRLVWLVEEYPVADLPGDLPVLIVRTSRDPGPGVALGPLPEEDAIALLRDLAPLAPAEVQRLVERGGGNPQILALLAQDPVLPPSLKAASLQRALDLCPARDALTLAAILGPEVKGTTWEAACRARGLERPDLQPLVLAGFLTLSPPYGFRFANSPLREALLDHPQIDALRVALAPALLERVEEMLRIGNPTPAERLLQDLADLPLPDDLRSVWLRQSAWLATWREAPAQALAEEALRLARTPGTRSRALSRLASVLQRQGDPRAAALRAEAWQLALEHGLQRSAIESIQAEATALVREGRVPAAAELLEELARRLPDPDDPEAYPLHLLASWLAIKQGQLERTIDAARRARPGAWACGNRMAVYHSLNYEGDALRLRGEPLAAESCFAEAVALTEAMGTQSGSIARLNQALLMLQRGAFDEARPLLVHTADEFAAQERAPIELSARLWLLATLSGPEREACLSRIESLLERAPGRDPDVLEAARFAQRSVDDPRLTAVLTRLDGVG